MSMKHYLFISLVMLTTTLYAFEYGPDTPVWEAVNDSVMGGISVGGPSMMKSAGLRFAGILSLENNGGFSSIRSNSDAYAIEPGKELLLTVRGDGRTYYFDLRTSVRQRAFTYRQAFETTAGELQEIRLPLSGFYASRFGRRMPQADALDPAAIKSIGITLSDNKAGPFRLDVLNLQLVDAEMPKALSVENLLALAIRNGVPLYNRGDADACAAVYETALSALLLLPKETLSLDLQKMVGASLQAGAMAGNADDKAWALRRGIDLVMEQMK
jgi:monofunctional biosynthetic peptidoglycan transglycosylase